MTETDLCNLLWNSGVHVENTKDNKEYGKITASEGEESITHRKNETENDPNDHQNDPNNKQEDNWQEDELEDESHDELEDNN